MSRDFLVEIEKRGSMDQPLKELLEELSRRYQTAYYFSSNRISDCYGWVKACNGKVIRCFEFIGDYGVVLNQGELSDEERGLAIDFERLNQQLAEEVDDYTMPTEEDVIEIASVWSINPLDN